MLSKLIYQNSPHSLRDLFVTIYGIKMYHLRYTKNFEKYFHDYINLEKMSPTQIMCQQEKDCLRFIRYSASHSPFYKMIYQNISMPSKIEELSSLPIVNKEMLRQNIGQVSTVPISRKHTCIQTSGSTGTPMSFYFLPMDIQARWAVLEAWKQWFLVGTTQGSTAVFSGKIIKPMSCKTKQFWQTNYFLKQRFYSSYHLTYENLPYYIDNLNKFTPTNIVGYPSALAIVGRYILAGKYELNFRPKIIFTTAETLQSSDRQVISEAFGCPVRNQYASSEGAPFIVECEHDNYHFLSHSGVLEVLDEDNRPAKKGRAVVTCFFTQLMPLIRYDIGDFIELAHPEKKCPCNRPFPLVEQIIGREEDYLITSERGPVGRLDPIFKGLPSTLIRTQIVQNKIDEIEVHYVPDKKSFTENDLLSLKYALRERLGTKVMINFIKEDKIINFQTGKFKAVVCNIKEIK